MRYFFFFFKQKTAYEIVSRVMKWYIAQNGLYGITGESVPPATRKPWSRNVRIGVTCSARSRPQYLATLGAARDRKSTRPNSSHSQISYAVFCLKKKKKCNNYGSSC